MQNLNDFDRDVQLLLDMIGGEPLAKSDSRARSRTLTTAQTRRTSDGNSGN